MASPSQRHPLHALTSLRFVAAFGVVIHHLVAFGVFHDQRLALGIPAVSFFFTLSGFVLAYGYADRLRSTRDRWRFLFARFARLWPLHAATMLFSAYQLFALLDVPLDGAGSLAAKNLLLLHAWFNEPGVPTSFNGPSWSISVEAFFYVMFPAIIWALSRVRWNERRLIVALVGVVAAVWVLGFLMNATTSVENTGFFLYFFPPVRILEFVAGVLLGLLFPTLGTKAESPDPTASASSRWTGLELATILLIAALAWFTPDMPVWMTRAATWLPASLAVILIFALGRGHVARAIAVRPFRVLGEASYSLYMWHVVVIVQVVRVTPVDFITAYPRRGAVFVAVVSILVSLASWRWIEIPARRWLLARRVSGRTAVQRADAPPAWGFLRRTHWLLPAIVPIGAALAALRLKGHVISDFVLNVPDDAYYWHQIATAAAVGNGGGYTVYEELPAALWSHFGAWGPAYPMLNGVLTSLVPLAPNEFPWLGIGTFAVLAFVACRIARSTGLRSVLLAGMLVITWAAPIGLVTALQEPMHIGIGLVLAALVAASARRPDRRVALWGIAIVLLATVFRPAWVFMALPFLFVLMRGRSRSIQALILAATGVTSLAVIIVTMRMISPLPYEGIPGSAVMHPTGLAQFFGAIGDTVNTNVDALGGPIVQYRTALWGLAAIAALLAVLAVRIIADIRAKRPRDLAVVIASIGVLAAVVLPFVLIMTSYTIVTGLRHLGPHLITAFAVTILLLDVRRDRMLQGGVAVSVMLLVLGLGAFRDDFDVETRDRYSESPTMGIDSVVANVSYQPHVSGWCNTVLFATPNPFGPHLIDMPAGVTMSVILLPDGPVEPRSRWLLVSDTSRPQFAMSTWSRYEEVGVRGERGALYRKLDDGECRT